MIWFFVCGLIAIVCWAIAIWNSIDDRFELGMALTAGFFFAAAFTVLISFLLNLATGLFIDSKSVEQSRHNLLSLNDTSVSSGSFFLGSGSYDEEPAFFYYQEGSRGATLEHVDADRVVIIQEEIDQPYVAIVNPDVSTNILWYTGGLGESEYEFHIPEGSINNSFRLDAE